jgi:predicted metal-dependent hydrolase
MIEEKIIPWSGQIVTVQKKPIKNVYLKVLPPEGRILLSVPKGYSRKEIEEVLESRREWLLSRQQVIRKNVKAPTVRQYVTGDKIPVWGKTYELVVREVPGNRARVTCKGDKVLLLVPGYATREQRRQVLNDWYRHQLERVVATEKTRLEALVGKTAAEWRFRDMHTRWGTCNVRARRIWLSIHLAKQAPEAFRYVAIHELTHLWEANHGAEFKARMDRYYPDWRTVRKQMNAMADFE